MSEVSFTGTLTADPHVYYTANARANVQFVVAKNRTKFNADAKRWQDKGEPVLLTCNAYGPIAERVLADALEKGQRVTVTGDLITRSYADGSGGSRTELELEVEQVGPSLAVSAADRERGQVASAGH